MQQLSTQNQLLQHLYNELPKAEAAALNAEIASDWWLREEHADLIESHRRLPKATFYPKHSTIQNILNHSKKTVSAFS